MKEIYHICAQPADFYYSWQVDAMLLSFEKFGEVDLTKVHVVSAVYLQNPVPNEHFKLVQENWEKKGVVFDYYKDTRQNSKYISSIRPHLLKKHWQKYPWLEQKDIFYHDCDIVLSKKIDFDSFFDENAQKECYLSDTRGYIGPNYIKSKGHDLLEDMCKIAFIDPVVVEAKEEESGGAQYLLRPGIDYKFWDEVYDISERLFHEINQKCLQIKRDEPDWHELQIWCADMWAVLWSLWKRGYKTPIKKELNFTWANQKANQWPKNAIFHNAGVVKQEEGKPFYKAMYMNKSPMEAPIPDEEWASYNYLQLVREAWANTTNN